MITKAEAQQIAQRYLDGRTTRVRSADEVRTIDDEWTLEREYGWLFIYNTAGYVRTRDRRRYGLVGNGPLLVLREDGALIQFSSAYDREEALEEYEANPQRFEAKKLHLT